MKPDEPRIKSTTAHEGAEQIQHNNRRLVDILAGKGKPNINRHLRRLAKKRLGKTI